MARHWRLLAQYSGRLIFAFAELVKHDKLRGYATVLIELSDSHISRFVKRF